MTMQGKGKVRLIAKKGRFRETDYTADLRNLRESTSYNESVDAHGGSVEKATAAAEKRRTEGTKAINNLLLAGEGLENYYIEFDATPDITETGSVSYFEAGEIRGPSSILMYMGSPSRSFTINAKLIARNAAEAIRVDKQIHILKSWRMPESYTGGIDAGTPSLLYLQGYGKMFKDIPCVMTDLSFDFSSEHDYVGAGTTNLQYREDVSTASFSDDGQRIEYIKSKANRNNDYETFVPIITPVSITLKEAHSVEGELSGLEGFDILKYRNGVLPNW